MARQEDQIAPRPPGTVEIPLSAAQRRLWWTDQRQPGSPGNNCWIAVRLHGALDLGALRSSLRDILRRHEALRTRFAAREGRPVQIIDPGAELALDLVDLATTPQNTREQELSAAMRKAGDEPFDLATGPLMRTTLIRMGPQDHVLVLAIHHLVTDSWSLRVLYDEFAALYQAHSHGTPVQLRPPPAHYPDFSLWQQRGLSAASTDAGLTYWRAKLAGLPRLELPADWPHPPVATLDWSVVPFTLDERDVAALASLGRQQRSTWFMTTLAVFLVLVSRYSGQKDFGVSTAVSGRPRSQMAGSVGFFMNTVVLRNDLSGVRTFRELVNLVRETTIDALTNAEVPFEQLVEELLPARDPGRVPLAPVAFIQDNTPSTGPALDGLRVEPIANQPGGFTFDLLMALGTNDEQPRGTVRYRTDLFARETIERLVEHYTMLVHAVSHDPDAPVWTLPLLTPQEEGHLTQVNNTAAAIPDLAVHDLFEVRAATAPDAIAATQIGRELTYHDLDTTANRLAHWLAELGVGRGDRVGLATGHTAAMLIAQLAILKTGAAIIPLAPGESAEFVAGHSRTRAVLTDTWGVDSLVPLGIPVIDVDSPDLRSYPGTSPDIPVHPDTDTALVLYAGDPFGSPTGVELTHRGLVTTFTDLNTRLEIGRTDTTLALSPARFAGNAYQTLGMLIAGGKVMIPDHSRAHDPTHWAKLLSVATVLSITPRQAEQLLETAETLPTLRHVMIDGRHQESLPARIATIAPSATVTSLYGTVEASFHSLIHPEGTVLANHEVHILDRAMQPVPTGVPGVLHLGGTALAKGYLNQNSLTSTRFPHWRGQRLFRTNTLARWRRDGTIEFLSEDPGSLRHVRANEVASVLREHEQVADATAAVRRDFEEDQIMVGYLVAGPTGALDLAEIRKGLEDRLPSHLVPDQLVVLDEIPMCPDGQVDWMALPGVDC